MGNKEKRVLAGMAALLVTLNLYSCSHKKYDKNVPTNNGENYYGSLEPKYNFHYENDTVDVEDSIDKLGLTDNDNMPYSTYKVFRFIDQNNFEKIVIANAYVTYLTDSEGKVTHTIYTYVDAFNGELLFTTFDNTGDHVHNKVENYSSDIVTYIMDQGDLLDLKRIVIGKGLDSNYANSVMSDDIKNKSLSKYDVAIMYVLLVNSNNRTIDYNHAIILN